MVNNVTVQSWNELNDCLYEGSWKESLGRFRSNYAYRGMPSISYDLRTSLMRLGGDYPDLEAHLLRTFRRYAPRYAEAANVSDSIWNWLAIAQHHGLPTRMLDITYSPYVALHFATSDLSRMDQDAVVWCINYPHINQLLPNKLKSILQKEGAQVFTAEMLRRGAETLQEFDKLSSQPFVAFFEPPSLDDRIVNQYALFALMSHPTARFDEWLARHPDMAVCITIPAGLKWEVRDKLDQANITERVLFPGLDGLSLWLKRYYTPRLIDDRGR